MAKSSTKSLATVVIVSAITALVVTKSGIAKK